MPLMRSGLRCVGCGNGVVFGLLLAAAAGHAEEWHALFDGATLAGWEAADHPESFRVEDGAIAAAGRQITVSVNGAPVVEYDEPPAPERKNGRERRLLPHGQIALQAYDPKSMVY